MEITINYYGQAVSVSVEVYEFLTQADHKTENLAHEQRRHWDGREFDEYIISTEGRLPYCATPGPFVGVYGWGYCGTDRNRQLPGLHHV